MARQSVSKHLAVLETAKLVTRSGGAAKSCTYLNADPIRAIAEHWIEQYGRAPAQRVPPVADLARRVGSAVGQQQGNVLLCGRQRAVVADE